MTLLIPVATSNTDYFELRYALRSVEKYVPGIDKIVIVGAKPDWIKDVTHIPFNDAKHPAWKAKNIIEKALQSPDENFLFSNDDFFFLKPVDAETFPYYSYRTIKPALAETSQNNMYRFTIENTYKAIGDKPFYNIHCPIRYSLVQLQQLYASLDWSVPHGYLIKTMYCNRLNLKGTEQHDIIFRNKMELKDIVSVIKDAPFFGINDVALNDAMIKKLKWLFLEPSKWES